MRIIFTGGGTVGSVSPLIAIAEKLMKKYPDTEILWIGTKNGPEKNIILNYQLNYASIPAGKLRRYFSLKNLSDVFKTAFGFIKSTLILARFKPHIIIGAGSFIQVPLIYAAGIFFKKQKIIIHQQDIQKGLANRLCERFADIITVSVPKSLNDFKSKKTVLTGNPVRKEIKKGDLETAFSLFSLEKNLPIVLILGGGAGALSLNQLVIDSINKLTKFCQVIHITGKDKKIGGLAAKNSEKCGVNLNFRYRQYEFTIKELKDAYAAADIVVSRAGFSTLSELAALSKPVIIVPLLHTHQESNAKYWQKEHAAIVLRQDKTDSRTFTQAVKQLLENKELRFKLSSSISTMLLSDADERFLKEIEKLMDNEKINIKKW